MTAPVKKHIHYYWMKQGEDEWHARRDGKYSGSNADKTLRSATSKRIVNGVVSNYAVVETSDFTGNFWTERGHLLEDEAIELYEAIKGVKIMRNDEGIKVGIVENDKFPNCIYSPDGIAPVPIIEVKCFDKEKHMELVRGDIPFKILAQIHYGLAITERPFAHLIAYNPKMERVEDKFKIHTIKRDVGIINNFKRILGGA